MDQPDKSRGARAPLFAAFAVATALGLAVVGKTAKALSEARAAAANEAATGKEVDLLAKIGPDLAIAGFEIVVIALVFAFRRWWLTWAAVAAMFGGYTGYVGYMAATGAVSCGCFGAIKTPPAVSLSIDLAGVALGLFMMRTLLRAKNGRPLLRTPRPRLAATLVAAAALSAVGSVVARMTTDPPPPAAELNNPAIADVFAELFAQPSMADAASDAPFGPHWVLFIYDPFCEHCQSILPTMLAWADRRADDDALRVVVIDRDELADETGIGWHRWPTTPTIALVKQGVVVELLPHLDEWSETDLTALRERVR